MTGARQLMLVLTLALATPLAALADGGDGSSTQPIVAEWAAVDHAISQAQHKLAAAEQALKVGRTPLPGERRGNADGYSRLLPAYFKRVAGLEQDVAEARRQLDAAYALRRELPEYRNYQGPVQTPAVQVPAGTPALQAPR